MSYIEGITPPKRHKTVGQMRGEFSQHHHLRSKEEQQRRSVFIVVAVTVVLLVVVWMILLQKGHLIPKSDSDKSFINSLAEEIQEADVESTIQPTNVQTYDEIREDLF